MSERERWTPDTDWPEAAPTESSTFQVETLGVQGIVSVDRPDWTRRGIESAEYRLKAYAARRMLERVEVKWPADWWEAFKERWFPAWALKRWPVRYNRRRLEAAEWLHRQFLDGQQSRVAVEVLKPVSIPEQPIATPPQEPQP